RSGGGQRSESSYPGPDFVGRGAAVAGDEGIRPLVQLVEMTAVDDLQELVVEVRGERLEVAFAAGELPGCLHHCGLPGRSLFRGHRTAMHDPLDDLRRRGRQGRNWRIMRQTTGSHYQDPRAQGGQVAADCCAERVTAMQRTQRGGDRVDEDRNYRLRRRGAE